MVIDYLARPGMIFSDAFRWRKRYKELLFDEEQTSHVVDTWYEKPNYGLLDGNFRPVIFLTDESGASVRTFTGFSEDIRAACFVVDAFQDMRADYLSTMRTAPIQPPAYLTSMEPKKGFENFEEKYNNYLNLVRLKLISQFQPSVLNNIVRYSDFHEEVIKISENFFKIYPITMSGFLLSPKCTPRVSGLYLDLYDKGMPERDYEKSKIVQSVGFRCYMEYANEYGFYIDKNQPWRLIANLESEKMQQYIRRYSPGTDSKETLNYLFRARTEFDDIYSMRNFMVSTYLTLKDDTPLSSRVEYSESGGYEVIRLRKRAISLFDGLGEEYWLSLLLRIRMCELGIDKHLFSEYNEQMIRFYRKSKTLQGAVSSSTDSSTGRNNQINPALWWIGNKCSDFIKEVYTRHQNINSAGSVTLSDYYNTVL